MCAKTPLEMAVPTFMDRIGIRSFVLDPSVASSLKFLRKTPWAREKVEGLYLFMLREQKRPVQQRRSDSPT